MCNAYYAGAALTQRSGGQGATGAAGSLLTRVDSARGEGPRTQISAPAAPAASAPPPAPDISGYMPSTQENAIQYPDTSGGSYRRISYRRLNKGRFSFNIGGGSDSSGSALNIPQ